MQYKRTLLLLSFLSSATLATVNTKYTPVINPSPQYRITVQGNIDPAIAKQVHLKWTALYKSTNPKCMKTKNAFTKFEGAWFNRELVKTYLTNTNKQGQYKIAIPLDKYRPGYCGWTIESVTFSLNGLPSLFVSSFDSKQHAGLSSVHNIFLCQQQGKALTCHVMGVYKSFNAYAKLNKANSYTFSLDVKGNQ